MEIPARYLERLQASKRPLKITSERQDLIQRFTDKINGERVGTKWKPVIWRQINGLVAHVKIADLYWFYKRCDEGDNFSKKFFGILKSMRVVPPPTKKKTKMEKEIVQNGAAVLRQKAAEIPLAEITNAKMKTLITEMQAALESQDDGVALAAPQVGASVRLFIVSKAALALPAELKERDKAKERRELKKKEGYLIFINPRLTKLSREKTLLEEGCLSVRPLYGKIKRSKKATITAYDENGTKFTRGASGLLAQVFQHETDHLNGILFVDKAIELHEMKTDYEK